MTENPSQEPNFSDELHELGKNLSNLLRAAWASDERKKVQQDIESTLSGLSVSIDQAADNFSQSETGKNLKEDIKDISKKIETGEAQEKARQEVLEALKTVNGELSKVINNWSKTSTAAESKPTNSAEGTTSEGEPTK